MFSLNLLKKQILAELQGDEFETVDKYLGYSDAIYFTVEGEKIPAVFCSSEDYIREMLASSTNYEYQLERIHFVRDGFGFSEGRQSFCHASKMVGVEQQDFEKFCKNDYLFIIHSYKTEKGLKASWFCPINYINDKTVALLKPIVGQAIIKCFEDKAIYDARQVEAERAATQKEAALEAIVGKYRQVVLEERNNYGGKREYKFLFEKNVDKDTFVQFLDLFGLRTEAERINAPISQEEVVIRPIVGGWYYKWLGSYTD